MSVKAPKPIVYPGFLNLPKVMTCDPDFVSLSGPALKLLIGIGRQYNGGNNGDLCATWSMMRHLINSKSGLQKAIEELVEKTWIEQTRQGGRRAPSLYAITWQAINHCGGKLDVPATKSPRRRFKK